MSDQAVFRYTGGEDGGSLPGVPRRDLTAADVERLTRQGHVAAVKGSSLYENAKRDPVKQERAKTEQTATKEGGD